MSQEREWSESSASSGNRHEYRPHPRTVGWFGTTCVAMGGINQSLFLIGALFIGQEAILGQGSAAVPLLIFGLLLSWAATPGWTELILMYPNRVGGIAATCAEAFRPYSPVLANLTGVCYWWGWVPTCGLTALLSASAINQWYAPWFPVPLLAASIVTVFTVVNLCGVKWVMRMAMPIATASAILAFLSAVIPIFSGSVDWQQAFTYHLTVPFQGIFGQVTSVMAGIYLIGFAAPAFEQASCHVGETINPNKNVPRAMLASALLASLYFIILPVVWLGALGPEPLGKELALELGPTFAPLLGGLAKGAAIWFMILNMFHGTIAPLAGAARTLAQLAEDGLLPEFMAKRSKTDAPWVTTVLTAVMAIAFLLIGDPVWLIAAANLTYLIGIGMPNIAVWLLRKDEPNMARPYRAPRGTILLGVVAAGIWGLSTVLGFQQFGMSTVLIGITFAYSGAALYAWRKMADRRKLGLPLIARTLHLKLTGAMLLVLAFDAVGYFIAIEAVPRYDVGLITALEDIFVVVALLTIAIGLILPGMIAHSAVEVSKASELLVKGTLADFTRAMQALAAGDLDAAKANFTLLRVVVHSRDEVGDMAENFNRLQEEIGLAAVGLAGAREGLLASRQALTVVNQQLQDANAQLTHELAERKMVELSLRESQQHLREVQTALDEHALVAIADQTGRLTYVNKRFCEVSQYAQDELVGQTFRIINSGFHTKEFFTQMWHTIARGHIWQGEIQNRAKDGSPYWVETTIVPCLNAQGKPYQYIAIRTDITARRKTEFELASARDAAQAANRSKSQFLANMSHEIRTPMNGVIGMTGLLEETTLDPDQQDIVQTIRKSGDLLLTIINDILDFSKIEAGKLAFEMQNFNLREVVEDTLEMLQETARTKGLELAGMVDDGVFSQVSGDAGRLRQVLTNLLNNAIKFTLNGKVILRVTRVSDKMLRFEVIDSGIGISPSDQERLFEPFSQVDGSAARKYGGTGLGLAIARQLVQFMQGEIGVTSRLGHGSTFWFTAHFEHQSGTFSPVDQRLKPNQPANSQGSADSISPSSWALRPMARILLAEDNMINQKVALRMLAKFGYQADTVANGNEVLEAIKRMPYDIIFMDCQMPDLDGYETTKRIRLTGGRPIHIIAMTANAMEGDREKCLDAGMNDYISKPVKALDIQAALNRWQLTDSNQI